MNNIITKFFASLLAYRVANKKKRFSAIGHFSEGLAPARGKIQWGYIDKENQEILPFKYDIAEPFYNNIARAGLYGKSMKIKGGNKRFFGMFLCPGSQTAPQCKEQYITAYRHFSPICFLFFSAPAYGQVQTYKINSKVPLNLCC